MATEMVTVMAMGMATKITTVRFPTICTAQALVFIILTCSDNDGNKKHPDSSKSTKPTSSVTTTIVSVPPPTTVVIPPVTLTSTLVTTTEISTMTTQTESSATTTSFTISITTTSVPSVPGSSSQPGSSSSLGSSSSPVGTSSSNSVTPTTVLPTSTPTPTSSGTPGAISSSELSPGVKAGIASRTRTPWRSSIHEIRTDLPTSQSLPSLGSLSFSGVSISAGGAEHPVQKDQSVSNHRPPERKAH